MKKQSTNTITWTEYNKLLNKKSLKYRNKKVIWDGKLFDSTKELKYYWKLLDDKKSGKIRDFEWQVPLTFIYEYEKMFKLIIDFVIKHNIINNIVPRLEYIDVKGWCIKKKKFLTTPMFNLKKKLIEAQYGIKIILK